MAITPPKMNFSTARYVESGKFKIAAIASEANIEIGVLSESHAVYRCVLSVEELTKVSDGLFNSTTRLKALINDMSGGINLSFASPTLTIRVPLLDRSVTLTLTTQETTAAERYQFLKDEFEAYKRQMNLAIEGYRRQLEAKLAKKRDFNDFGVPENLLIDE